MKTRNLFWPFFLIAAGVIWVLVNTGVIAQGNLWALTYYWPFLLIAVGLGLILRTRWSWAGALISALVVIGAVAVVVFAPQLGWNNANFWAFGSGDTTLNFNGGVAGSRNVITQTRSVDDFTAINVNYPIKVTIQQGQATSLTIQAEDNLMPQLSTKVSGGTLVIENSEPSWGKRINPTRTVEVNITVKDLNSIHFSSAESGQITGLQTDSLKITVSGAGSVTLTGLKVKSLDLQLSGAGSVKADGTADQTTIHISGLGSFDGANLAAQSANLSISGLGSATLWTKTTLNANISGTGSINYYGSPNVQQAVSGLGSVRKLGDK
jgi:hypothetical protein